MEPGPQPERRIQDSPTTRPPHAPTTRAHDISPRLPPFFGHAVNTSEPPYCHLGGPTLGLLCTPLRTLLGLRGPSPVWDQVLAGKYRLPPVCPPVRTHVGVQATHPHAARRTPWPRIPNTPPAVGFWAGCWSTSAPPVEAPPFTSCWLPKMIPPSPERPCRWNVWTWRIAKATSEVGHWSKHLTF